MIKLLKNILIFFLLITIIFALSGCNYGLTQEEIEQMKIEETIGRYFDGFAMNDSKQILETMSIDESTQEGVKTILDSLLKNIHRNLYVIKFVYDLQDVAIHENRAEVKISAVMRIYDKESEVFSIRLFKDKTLELVKESNGEWKIDMAQFVPEELLKIDLLF